VSALKKYWEYFHQRFELKNSGR